MAVVCVGILVSDTFCGPVPGIPEEGLLELVDSIKTSAGGCAANVAIDLAKIGVEVDVIGTVGKDHEASVLLSCLKENGVGIDQVAVCDKYPTSRCVILLVENEDRRFIYSFGANKAFSEAQINKDRLATRKIFYLGGLYVLPAIDTNELVKILKFCKDNGIVTVIDVVLPPNFEDFDSLKKLLPHIDFFLPNNDEAKKLTGCLEPMDQAKKLLSMGANVVVVTMGSEGAIMAKGNEYWRAGVYDANLIDPSGAGDAFAAGLIYSIENSYSYSDMLRLSSALASSSTKAIGTTDGVYKEEELKTFVANNKLEVAHGYFK